MDGWVDGRSKFVFEGASVFWTSPMFFEGTNVFCWTSPDDDLYRFASDAVSDSCGQNLNHKRVQTESLFRIGSVIFGARTHCNQAAGALGVRSYARS